MSKRINPITKTMQASTMNHAFIVQALEDYCGRMLEDKSDWGNSWVAKEAWQQSAKEYLESIKQWRSFV